MTKPNKFEHLKIKSLRFSLLSIKSLKIWNPKKYHDKFQT